MTEQTTAAVKPQKSPAAPVSRTEILEAISPYITGGPSGLKAVIGTSKITLTREGRKQEFPRNVSVDTLIDASVELTGPLTEDEVMEVAKEFPQVQTKVSDDQIVMQCGKVIVTSSLEATVSHIRSVALNLVAPKEKLPPVLGAGGKPV